MGQDLKKSMSIKPERDENIKLGFIHFSYLLHSRLRKSLVDFKTRIVGAD